jgi:trimeric autotransporter adhesin
VASYADKVIADGATAYWRLGETSGLTAVDIVGGKNGTISGGVTLGQTGALADADKAMAFADGGYIQMSPSAVVSGWKTFEGWFKTSVGINPATNYILFNDQYDGVNGRVVRINGDTGGIVLVNYSGGAVAGAAFGTRLGLCDQQWHHIVVNNTGTTYAIWLDGVQDASGTIAAAGISTIAPRLSASVQSMVGTLDDIAIYSTALTAQQIATHYALSKYAAGSYPAQVISDGATALWRLGETSGTTASDSVGTAHGTISGGVTLGQAGALADGDKAMLFDGATGKITTSAVTLAVTSSIELWFKTSASGQGMMVSDRDGVSSNAIVLYINSGTLIIAGPTGVSSTGPLMNDGNWHHCVVTLDASTARFYVDGAANNSGAMVRAAVTLPFLIAADGGGNPANFPGSLDEVATYPTALTPAQIANHYAARLFSDATLPIIPWAVVGGMAPWSNDMDAYNLFEPITPHDSADINVDGELTDAILVGGAGDIAAVMSNKQVVVLKGLPAGAWVPVACRRINATGTTATNLVALYQV